MALHSPRFGAGGNSDGFYAAGYKSSLDACEYLFRMGLSAYEYECTHGVRLSDAFCSSMRKSAHDLDIALSVHAPYYINLASGDDGIRAKSIMHILKALRVAEKMGARSVVFHPGTVGELRREEAMARAEELLEEAVFQAEREGLLETVFLCPETMGKQAQLGTLAEVLRLCEISEGLRPAVDFAHIHALTGGGLRGRTEFERILHKIERRLGEEVVANLHVHFSPIEYTKAGERRHRTLRDKGFGPDFEYFADILAEHDWQPTIICESAGTQDEDACIFHQIYEGSLRDHGIT